MNTPIMKAYEIFYFAPKDMKIDHVYIAESSIDAIKQFVIANKGKYNVFCALEVGLWQQFLERGDKHLKKTVYETTCTNCESVLEFEEHEAKCSTNRNELYFEVKCPVCDKTTCADDSKKREVVYK